MDNTDTGAPALMDDQARFAALFSTAEPAASEPASEPAQEVLQDPGPPEAEAAPTLTQPEAQIDELAKEREEKKELERRLSENEALLKRVLQLQQIAQPQPQAQDHIEDDPFAAMRRELKAEMEPQIQQIIRMQAVLARESAERAYTPEAVRQAQAEFDDLIHTGQMDPATYTRITQAPNPFTEVVNWQRERQVVRDVGADPEAYKQRIREEALKDPAFLAKALEQAKSIAQPSTPVTQPKQALVPSVSRLGAAPVAAINDMSDEDRWAAITAQRNH